jgi:hypothetical protein
MSFSRKWKRFRESGAFASLLGALICGTIISGAVAQTPVTKAGTSPSPINDTTGGPNVLTHHNDISRTGANLSETILKLSNVKPATGTASGFGKLFTRKVDGQMYAQPLYVSQLLINGKRRNVVFLATMHSTVYAYDADDPNATEPLWVTSFLDESKGFLPCPIGEVGGWDTNIYPEVGVVSTPVIDLSTLTLYCTSKVKDVINKDALGGPTYPTFLHALNIITGKARTAPIRIEGGVPGSGDADGDPETGDIKGDGWMTFNPKRHQNRPGLLLSRGILYIAFGAHSDITPYHGWVFAYDAKTMKKLDVWCSTPNGKTDPSGYPLGAGGIWQSGQGLNADSQGNVYLEIGNGSFSADKGGADYGDSFVKLRMQNNKIVVADYFTPYNQDWLNRVDADLGVTGPMLIPGTSLLVGGGKEGRLYVMNRDKMGKYNPDGDNQITQWFWGYPAHLHGAPVFFNGANGSSLFYWGEYDRLKAYRVDTKAQKLLTTPFAMSDMYVPPGMPGAAMSVSANQTQDGIVWSAHPYDDDAIHKVVWGILRAFDASTLRELWNSKMVPERDDVGLFAKFTPPTVAGGKVYLATFSNELVVYGIGKWAPTPVITPASGEYRLSNGPVVVTMTVPGAPAGTVIRYTLDGTEPLVTSTAYTTPISLRESSIVKAKAFVPNFNASGVAVARYLIDDGPGNGDGLSGFYFNNIDLNGTPVTRIDPIINFLGIGGQIPIPGVGPDWWSARWTGKVLPRASGNYTFTTGSDDGIRLWVDGKLLVDNWTYHGYTENSGTIYLKQGVKYDIRLEFFEGLGGADCALFWQSDFFGRQIVPQSQLFSK